MRNVQRNQIIETIRGIEDEEILDALSRWLEVNTGRFPLSEEQKKELEQARLEISRGEGIPEEEIEREMEEWLKK